MKASMIAMKILRQIWSSGYIPIVSNNLIEKSYHSDERHDILEARKIIESKFSNIVLVDEWEISNLPDSQLLHQIRMSFRMSQFSTTEEGQIVFLKKLVSLTLSAITDYLEEFSHIRSQSIITGGIIPRLMHAYLDMRKYGDNESNKTFSKDNFDLDIFVYGDTGSIILPMNSNVQINMADDMTIERYRNRGDEIVKIRNIYECGAISIFGHKIPVQLILYNDTKTPDEIIETFDFAHVQSWFDMNTRALWISDEQFDCIHKKTLVPTERYEHNFSLISEKRVDKYIKQGYKR